MTLSRYYRSVIASRDNLLDRKLRLLGDADAKASAGLAMVSNRAMHSKGESRERPIIFFGIFFLDLDGIVFCSCF